MTQNEKNLLEWAVNKYGIDAQIMQTFEEMGELMSAINKYKRNRVGIKEIIEELADVSIMIDQLAVFYGYDNYKSIRISKLLRLQDRLEKMEP